MAQPVQLPDNVRRAVSTLYSVVSSLSARVSHNKELSLEEVVHGRKSLAGVLHAVDELIVWLHDGEGPLAKGKELDL